MPWWAALLIATTAAAVGYAVDAGMGHKELTHVFAGFYIAGCVAAVLAVRQDGVFTAIIQPPLILFCAVPGAYWMFHGRKIGNLKDLLINCGYPLIERFPLMLGTAGAILLIGLVRWYFGLSHRTTTATENKDDVDSATTAKSNSFVSAIATKLNSLLGFHSHEDDPDQILSTESQRTRATSPPRKSTSKATRASRSARSASRPSRTHSRRGRPPLEDEDEPVVKRPRRRRPAPPRDVDPADPPRRSRRRPRPQDDPDLRAQPTRETRRDPQQTRRNPYERPYERQMPRSSRFDDYDMYEPYEPPRRRAASGGNGANPTHHPISRVRYRGEAPLNEPRDEPHAEHRSRSRSPRPPADSWE